VSERGSARWDAFGTTVVVVVDRAPRLQDACRAVREVIDAVDAACNRFRPDSEISRVNCAGGEAVRVSGDFVRAARCALRAASVTDGDLDPTIGRSLRVAGYDRDFARIASGQRVRFTRAAGWRCVELDDAAGIVRVPAGVELDFGATGKALAVDLAARSAHERCGAGVLVGIGGDLACAGDSPAGGWPVRVTDDHAAAVDAPGQTVALLSGGLATSSVTRRRWRRGTVELHHILSPATGAPAPARWRTVSTAAASCVDANVASTTAVIRGDAAVAWLEARRLPARLVAADGSVTTVAGWPTEGSAGT
jgi:FAD:protein FMN transferase